MSVSMLLPKANQRGQTLVEFALAALLFLTLILGIVEFGRALWTWNTIVEATRAGARYAVVETPTAANVKNYVVYYNAAGTGDPVLPGLTTSNVTVSFLKNDGTAATQTPPYDSDQVQVGITGYTFNFLVPLFGSGITMPPFTTNLPAEGLGVIPP